MIVRVLLQAVSYTHLGITVVKKDGTPANINGLTYKADDKGFTGTLPALGEDEYYELTYWGCLLYTSKRSLHGHKFYLAKVKFIFFLIFLIIFSKDCIFCCGSGTLDVIKIS